MRKPLVLALSILAGATSNAWSSGTGTVTETRSEQAAPAEASTTVGIKALDVSTVGIVQAGTGGLEVDPGGHLLVADFGVRLGDPASAGTRIWRIDREGRAAVAFEGFAGASGNTFDAQGNLYQANIRNSSLSKIDSAGRVRHGFAEGIPTPVGVVAGDAGDLFVTSCMGGAIYHVLPDGSTSRFAQSPLLLCPNGIARAGDGTLYVSNFANGDVVRIGPAGREISVLATLPGNSNGHLLLHRERLLVAARGEHRIYQVGLDGSVSPLAGTGVQGNQDGPADRASFSFPNDLAISPDGSVLFVNEVDEPASDGVTLAPTRIRRVELADSGALRPPGRSTRPVIEIQQPCEPMEAR